MPFLADADGGPILSDRELWAMIDEGQQIAVVQLRQAGTAQVDLFISLTDRSGKSHEVTFFLPLGIEADDFGVVEGNHHRGAMRGEWVVGAWLRDGGKLSEPGRFAWR